eukprot:CAMPEP_0203949226 /NCGR_PEP_ID=MMETSP0359-20131031/83684_1 /ASSEMBLY_ACC=CAM_ASM_000338 /TAXON_ID=268821 /ORGANISM="Scrippsiella Hangoei, Strain SHTV-5" /LENGTH=65 /DNA_ID=CAMNT_0050881065 /DNA_START=14 /DNA_END=207 /DNA_ORIENTATION=+
MPGKNACNKNAGAPHTTTPRVQPGSVEMRAPELRRHICRLSAGHAGYIMVPAGSPRWGVHTPHFG